MHDSDKRENGDERNSDVQKDRRAEDGENRLTRDEDGKGVQWGRRAVTLGAAATALGGLTGAAVHSKPAQPARPEHTAVDEPAIPEFAISKDWDLLNTKNEQVDFFIDFLQWKNHDKTKLWLERVHHFGPMIHQKLAERGMPKDLIWLATIESGLDPNAYSAADAAGLWQFIEETGERHGLEVSEYVDERRDPVAATDAALDYLQKLNKQFGGSWYLAAAGYNTGENRVERIVRERAGGKLGDENVFWQIEEFLPSETRDYVPLMLAMGHIGKDPAKHGFTDLKPQDAYAYDEVRVPGGVPLERVAKQIGVAVEKVLDLNPHLVKKTTPPGRDWEVRVPRGTGANFAASQGGAETKS